MSKNPLGWFSVSDRIAKDGTLSEGAKAVFMAIKSYYPNCHPSIETIIGHVGFGEKTVRRKIKELEKKGYLEVERMRGGINHYYMERLPGDGGNYYLRKSAVTHDRSLALSTQNNEDDIPW